MNEFRTEAIRRSTVPAKDKRAEVCAASRSGWAKRQPRAVTETPEKVSKTWPRTG